MSRSFRSMREGREALRKARQEAGMSTDYEIEKETIVEKHNHQQPQQPEQATQQATQHTASVDPSTEQLEAMAKAAAEAMSKQDPRLAEAELKLQQARIRRENASMVQACAMAVFAGLSACAVGIGMYSGHKHKGVAPAATPGVK